MSLLPAVSSGMAPTPGRALSRQRTPGVTVTRIVLSFAAILLATARVSAADADTLRDFQQTMDEVLRSYYEVGPKRSLTESTRLAYGAYVTFGYLSSDDMTGVARGFGEIDAKFWMNAEARGHAFYGRLRLQYYNYDAGDAFTASGDGLIEPLFDRYWYRFDSRADERAETGVDPGWGYWAQIGRQYVAWVSGMTCSDPLYAVRAGVEARSFAVEALLGVTPNHFVDFDASRPGFDSDTERWFWGIALECRAMRSHRPFVYFLAQEDENDQPFPGGPLFRYDSRYVGVGSSGGIATGAWLYRLELIYEFGDSISDASAVQTTDDIEAYGIRVYLAWMPPRARERIGLRIETEVLVGSGDDDRAAATLTSGGNLAGTSDRSFIVFGYVNTGLVVAPEMSNLVSVRVTGSAFPLRGCRCFGQMQVLLSGFLFAKYDKDAPVSVPTVPGESFVGGEIDLAIDWKIASDMSLILQYGIFLPGDAIADSDPLHFFYVGFSYGF